MKDRSERRWQSWNAIFYLLIDFHLSFSFSPSFLQCFYRCVHMCMQCCVFCSSFVDKIQYKAMQCISIIATQLKTSDKQTHSTFTAYQQYTSIIRVVYSQHTRSILLAYSHYTPSILLEYSWHTHFTKGEFLCLMWSNLEAQIKFTNAT